MLSAPALLLAQPATKVKLPATARGAAAISALGAHLPDVAKAYGLEAQGLATLLQTQPSLAVDTEGTLVFLCEGMGVQKGKAQQSGVSEGLSANSSITQIATGTTVDAFQLHSLPGASRVIYLDFDGHTTSGTTWNSAFTGGATIVSAPFDLDGNPGSFNPTERAVIQAIWQRVAEDYAPFAIDVTTQDPGVESLRKTTSGDLAYGVRVVITPSNFYGGGAGGVGYVGSFSWSSDTPCFVFSSSLANAEKYIAEAVSHEVGHTVGLNHDGVGGSSPDEYYYGQGNWAPIMGIGYYTTVTQFSKGEYSNATNTQDDYAVIQTHAPLVADDHGNTTATAKVLAGPNVADGGTIETRSDVDVFRFDTGLGLAVLNITSPSPESDLHMKAEILNSSGQVLFSNDANSLSAAFNVTLSAGTYYLRISGIGSGDPSTTGYTDYGSVGNYVITGTLMSTGTRVAPVARASSSTSSGQVALTVGFSGATSTDSDGSIVSYAWDFGNGATSSLVSPSYTYTTAGSYVATLTVTDNDGLSGTATLPITVTALPNQAPVAVASSNVQSGVAPLAITFSSNGSFDPDGTIASYRWDFGDGTSSTAASPAKTYSTPGNYSARLTVTDDRGSTASATVAISVTGDSSRDIDVSQYTLTRLSSGGGVSAQAVVIVLDRANRPVSGATVTMQWTGLVNSTTSAKTGADGRATITSGKTKKAGTINGEIKGLVAPAGSAVDGAIYNAPSTLSIVTK